MQGVGDAVIETLEEKAEHFLSRDLVKEESEIFFSTMVPWSFYKSGLDLDEHYLASQGVSNLLVSQMNPVRHWWTQENFLLIMEIISHGVAHDFKDDPLYDFAAQTMLMKSFFPESFKGVKPSIQTGYARTALLMVAEKQNKDVYETISREFSTYVNCLEFLNDKLKEASRPGFYILLEGKTPRYTKKFN
ncbi:hypothetical protein GOV05_04610 [Candidatus Woesearchaeota archaeon]|nr:hypothetical protein [Candidatus Woesearchaeota archaeon]